jgi:hypothetical protein
MRRRELVKEGRNSFRELGDLVDCLDSRKSHGCGKVAVANTLDRERRWGDVSRLLDQMKLRW